MYLDQAIVAALALDEAVQELALNKAFGAGLPSARPDGAWSLMVKGLIAEHKGDLSEAIALLRTARDREPTNVAVKSALASAYEHAGYGHHYSTLLTEVKQQTVVNKYDELFLARADEIYGPRESVAQLQKLVDENPHWLLARVMLASAKVEGAWYSGELREAEEARDQIRIVKTMFPDLPMVLAKELMANLCIAQLTKDELQRAAVLSVALDTSRRLETECPHYAPRELASYYFTFREDPNRAIEILMDASASGAGAVCESFLAAMLFHERRFEELASRDPSIWAILELRKPYEVVEHYHKLDLDAESVNIPIIWYTSLYYVAGGDREKQRATNTWRKLQAMCKDEPWNLTDALRWMLGEEDPDDLLEEAKQSGDRIRIAFSHFARAHTALIFEGDRKVAKEHYGRCIEYGILRIDIFFWAQAFLHLLEADPDWPAWAPKSGEAG